MRDALVQSGFALGLIAMLAGGGSRAAAQSFQLLGLPPGAEGSYAQAVSYSGEVVAGRAVGSTTYRPGWSWTVAAGHQDVTGPGLPLDTSAYGISGDGRYLVGSSGLGGINSPITAYRYDRMTGQADVLGALGGGLDQSRAVGASLDGSVVVGFSISDFSSNISRAVRWTEGGIQNLGVTRPGQHHHSEATAVSTDGNTVVGFSQGLTSQDAFLWTSTTGMTTLASFPGSTVNRAISVTSSGSVVVGISGNNAAMWVNGTIIDMGLAPGFGRSTARGVSDDGQIAIGQITNGPPSTEAAAIWFAGSGWQRMESYLTSIGVALPAGIDLLNATSISRDGRTITGYTTVAGNVQQPWVATIPSPGGFCILAGVCLYTMRRRIRPAGPPR